MSFSSLPEEVICQIFSYISDVFYVGDKTRLGRVSKQFRRLIQDGRSWELNTSLNLDTFRRRKYYWPCIARAVGSFLALVPQINHLEFSHGENLPYKADVLSVLYLHLPKLKITSLHYRAMEPRTQRKDCYCEPNMQLITWCLANFKSSLTKFKYECCYKFECRTLEAVAALLPSCHKLNYFQIKHVDIGKIPTLHLLSDPILEMLAGKRLTHLKLDNCSNLSGELAANLLNSVQGGTLRYFNACRITELPEFLEAVEPTVLAALKGVSMYDNSNSFMQCAPKLLEMGPNLEEFSCTIETNKRSLITPLEIAEMLDVVFEQSPRPKPLKMRLAVNREKREQDSFSQDFWRQICLVDSCKRGIKRTLDLYMEDWRWDRQLKMGNIKCDVEFRPYIVILD